MQLICCVFSIVYFSLPDAPLLGVPVASFIIGIFACGSYLCISDDIQNKQITFSRFCDIRKFIKDIFTLSMTYALSYLCITIADWTVLKTVMSLDDHRLSYSYYFILDITKSLIMLIFNISLCYIIHKPRKSLADIITFPFFLVRKKLGIILKMYSLPSTVCVIIISLQPFPQSNIGMNVFIFEMFLIFSGHGFLIIPLLFIIIYVISLCLVKLLTYTYYLYQSLDIEDKSTR